MCAQCAMVALAAVGTYGVFRDQIRAKIDQSLAAAEIDVETDGSELSGVERRNAPDPSPEPVSMLVFLLALGRLRHGVPRPNVVRPDFLAEREQAPVTGMKPPIPG
ncbi:MAG: hypothetical protein ACOC9Y_05990 [Chloroflexota bacterium]